MLFLEWDFRVAGADKVEELLAVLTDEGFLVVAGHIVPLDTVVVEVVEDGEARLTLVIFAVVWLRAAVTAGVGPVTQSALIGGRDLGLGTGPEPAVDDGWLQVGAAAPVEIAFAAASPDELDAIYVLNLELEI